MRDEVSVICARCGQTVAGFPSGGEHYPYKHDDNSGLPCLGVLMVALPSGSPAITLSQEHLERIAEGARKQWPTFLK
jgi:hypothetical protein